MIVRSALLAVSLLAIAVAAPAVAQAPATNPNTPTSSVRSVNLTMEQRHVIKEIILHDMKIAPVATAVPTGVGDVVPSGVPLQPIPVEVGAKVPAVKAMSFVVKNNTVLIVDPSNNKITETID